VAAVQGPAAPRAAIVWWHATRPATLAASVAPVLAGTAAAIRAGGIRPWAGALALLVAVAMQVGVNYANDYSDFVRGADANRRGPLRASSSGVVPPRHVKAAAVTAFGVAAIAGLVLSLTTDWRLLFAGMAAVAAGWLYTGGPRPYGYMGLGEVFVFVFFGLFATIGTTYVEAGRVTELSLLGGVATGALACGILVLNNIRDLSGDSLAGKRTLAVRLGRPATRTLLAALLVTAFAAVIAAPLRGASGPWQLAPLMLVPMALVVHRLSASRETPTLVAALKRCAALEMWFALLFAAGALSP